ncbi:MAG: NusA-like transcription termination signal-binding factor [Candidatus Thorarchaeota archaeon]|nr:MAG: NusA-like transcription termination signal-binding factor [Candidatus Thorarchaeota archaeon]RLI61379.1 MAG: NusA-like transcription termination signal-binding factor [Candidatus Thorarchaeota archaeon]
MPRVRLSMEDMALIATFERITGASAVDVVRDDEAGRLIFVVRPKQLGRAIGRGGANVRNASDVFGKTVDVVELADTAEEFVKSALAPARVERVRIVEDRNGSLIAQVTVKNEDRGIAIGRDGRNVARARILAKRHFGLDNVVIT